MILTSGRLVRGLRSRDLYVLDALLAAVLSVACGLSAVESPASGGWHEPAVVTVLTGVLIGGPVALRRVLPLTVTALSLTISAAALVSGVITDYASGSVVAVLACELYLVGSEVAARSTLTLAVTAVVLAAALASSPGNQGSAMGTAFACVVVAGAWLLGWIRRERRQHAAQVAEQRTQRAVADERLRIARELHDIVAHSMSLIAVRAGVADHVFEARPQEARAALRDIEAASRSALGQLRQAVAVLREPDGPYAPMPGLTDLRALADRAAAGGISVRLTITVEPAPGERENARPAEQEKAGLCERPTAAREEIPPATRPPRAPEEADTPVAGRDAVARVPEADTPVAGRDAVARVPETDTPVAGRDAVARVPEAVGLSAYRIVQEALTNAVKHAGPAACAVTVTVTVTPAEVRIRVVDGGVGPMATRSGGGGHGLIGMRERVAAWGGEFSAGPGGRGGFVVAATLPYGGAGV